MTVRYEVPDHVVSEVLDDEAVVVNLASGEYYALNEVGTRLLLLLRDGLDDRQACEQIAAEYGTAVDVVSADVDALLPDLVSLGILVAGR